MAITTDGLNVFAKKLYKAISDDTVVGYGQFLIFDSNFSYTVPNEVITSSTTGYVATGSFTFTVSNNRVEMSNADVEVTIPTGEYVKYYVITSPNSSYNNLPMVVNTTVSDGVGTYYQYGGKFVLTEFYIEVN